MNRDEARSIIAPFYDALSTPATKDVRALVEALASPDWRSFSGEGVSKGRVSQRCRPMGEGILTWSVTSVCYKSMAILDR